VDERHARRGDPDDDGFGMGSPTTPYPPPHRRPGRHEEALDRDDDGFGRGSATDPYEPPHRQAPGRHESDPDGTDRG
jgi:AGCS family alanine or glycine:cation symporter